MKSREQLIKDGYLRRITMSELPPGSWQRDWLERGNNFYEFNPTPAKVMGQIARREAAQAEQNATTSDTPPIQAIGHIAVQSNPSELAHAA